MTKFKIMAKILPLFQATEILLSSATMRRLIRHRKHPTTRISNASKRRMSLRCCWKTLTLKISKLNWVSPLKIRKLRSLNNRTALFRTTSIYSRINTQTFSPINLVMKKSHPFLNHFRQSSTCHLILESITRNRLNSSASR